VVVCNVWQKDHVSLVWFESVTTKEQAAHTAGETDATAPNVTLVACVVRVCLSDCRALRGRCVNVSVSS